MSELDPKQTVKKGKKQAGAKDKVHLYDFQKKSQILLMQKKIQIAFLLHNPGFSPYFWKVQWFQLFILGQMCSLPW